LNDEWCKPSHGSRGVGRYPDYYLQNFHWQTDGWLSTGSAAAYEYTTEALFEGTQVHPS